MISENKENPVQPMEQDNKEDFACKVCAKTFALQDFLDMHMLLHERKVCKICKESFILRENLKTHMMLLHQDKDTPPGKRLRMKRYPCKECKESFLLMHNLKMHLLLKECKKDRASNAEKDQNNMKLKGSDASMATNLIDDDRNGEDRKPLVAKKETFDASERSDNVDQGGAINGITINDDVENIAEDELAKSNDKIIKSEEYEEKTQRTQEEVLQESPEDLSKAPLEGQAATTENVEATKDEISDDGNMDSEMEEEGEGEVEALLHQGGANDGIAKEESNPLQQPAHTPTIQQQAAPSGDRPNAGMAEGGVQGGTGDHQGQNYQEEKDILALAADRLALPEMRNDMTNHHQESNRVAQQERERFAQLQQPQQERPGFAAQLPHVDRNRVTMPHENRGGFPLQQDERNRLTMPHEERGGYNQQPPHHEQRDRYNQPLLEQRERYNQPPVDERNRFPNPFEDRNRFVNPYEDRNRMAYQQHEERDRFFPTDEERNRLALLLQDERYRMALHGIERDRLGLPHENRGGFPGGEGGLLDDDPLSQEASGNGELQ